MEDDEEGKKGIFTCCATQSIKRQLKNSLHFMGWSCSPSKALTQANA